ncbi:MAG: propionyl-CoA synthetase, partial [Gammaproteobacteria bacterium]|nr:propionyl-CoA synthetase [Gammaproteobacteria bacterium]
MTNYSAIHRASIENPEEFWAEAAEGIDWDKRWDSVLDNPDPMTYRWFTGGRLNTCYNALDRHVERGRGDQAAIIY